MNVVKTYIDKDKYGGIGLFAAEFIPKGTLIWKFHPICDKIIPKGEMNFILNSVAYPKTVKDYLLRYTSEKDGHIIFYGDDAKFCNHSKTPNTHGYPEQFASVDICRGDEITCDYSEIHDSFSEDEFEVLKSYK